MAFGFLKKLWSGSDFWDKDENKSQRDSFAKQDEEERRRKEAARRASQQSFRSNSSFNGPTNDFFEKNSREQEGQKIDLSKKLTKVASQGGYQLENAKVANDAEKERTANDAEKAKWEKTLDQSLWDKVKDTVDPNTNADKLRRVKAGKEMDYKGPGGVVGGVKKYGSVPLRSTARVGTGMAQGATGLYDLASPGTGTSQLSKNLDENAKKLDEGAKQAGVDKLYKGANVVGEGLTFFGSGGSSALVKGSGKLTKYGTKVDKLGDLIKGGEDAGKIRGLLAGAFKHGANPAELIEEVGYAAKQTGEQSSKGEDISAKSVGTNIATGIGMNAGVGALGGLFKKARKGLGASDEAIEVIKKDVSKEASNVEAPQIPGTIKKEVEDIETPKVEVAPGVKSSNLAKVEREIAEAPTPAIPERVDVPSKVSTPEVTPLPSPITTTPTTQIPELTKVGDQPLSGPPIADFNNGAVNGSLKKLPEQPPVPKVPEEVVSQAETARRVAQGKPPSAPELDAQGNPALRSDVDLQKEIIDAGISPQTQPAPRVSAEDAMQRAADKASEEQVSIAAPVAKTDPQASLKQEARKYKSAEEFVKANYVAHGTPNKIEGNIRPSSGWYGKATYLTDDITGASGRGGGQNIYFVEKPKGKLLDIKAHGSKDNTTFTPKQYQDAIDNGYDGIRIKHDNGKTWYAMFKEQPAKTKQQLIDLYNEATQSQPPKSPIESLKQEAKKYKTAEDAMQRAADKASEEQVSGQVLDNLEQLRDPTTGKVAPSTTATERLLIDESIPLETRQAISNLSHDVKNEHLMKDSAASLVNDDPDLARQVFNEGSLLSGSDASRQIYLGNAIVDRMNRLGDVEGASSVYDDIIGLSSGGGSTLRAAQAISQISPQGIIRYAKNLAEKNGKEVTEALEKELMDASQAVAKMEPGFEKAVATKRLFETAQQPNFWEKAGKVAKDVLSAPRAIMTSFDLSFGGRQGAVLGSKFPKEWASAQKASAKYATSIEAFDKGMREVADLTDKNGSRLSGVFDRMELYLPGIRGKSEEAFGSTGITEGKFAKKIGIGHGIAASDRAFSGAATKMRADVAKKIIDGYGGVDAIKSWSSKDLSDLGKVINTATGRGVGKTDGMFEKAAPFLSDTLFSARLWKSRLDLLNPVYYAKLSPAARKVALQSSGSFAGVVGATLAAATAVGMDVETDPRSSDFGKIKVGNTRYDIMGGLQQNIVLATRELTGQKKSSTTGEVINFAPGVRFGEDGSPVSIGEGKSGFGGTDRVKTLANFVTNKETPVLGALTKIARGKDIGGNPVNPWSEVGKLFLPLGAVEVYSTAADQIANDGGNRSIGNITKGVAKTIPGFFGVGVQTYGEPLVDGRSPTLDLGARKNQLSKEGVPTSADDIKGVAESGDYAKAVQGAQYRLDELSLDKKATESSKKKAAEELEDYTFGKEYGYTPSSEKAVKARAERGDYDSAIAGWELRLKRSESDPDTPESELKKDRRNIEKYKVYSKAALSPELVTAYEKTSSDDGGVGVTAWREMMGSGDPEMIAYAEQLYNVDQTLLDAGVISKAKYTAKKGKGGGGRKGGGKGRGGGGGGGKGISTDIATQSAKGYSFTPFKAQSASFSAPQGAIPTLAKTPNYDKSKLKKITVTKGGRA